MRRWRIGRIAWWAAVAALPLLLVGLWVRSHFADDQLSRGWSIATTGMHPTMPGQRVVEEDEGFWSVESDVGSVVIAWGGMNAYYDEREKAAHPLRVRWGTRSSPAARLYEHSGPGMLGFHVVSYDQPLGSTMLLDAVPDPLIASDWRRGFVIPYWSLTSISVVLLALYVRRNVKAWRLHRAGLCEVCGYDLRASKDRCPECGTAILGGADSRALRNPK